MGKTKDLGMAKPDDPLFTGGYELFSRPEPPADPVPVPTSPLQNLPEDPALGAMRAGKRRKGRPQRS
jgi:hypothetical protein